MLANLACIVDNLLSTLSNFPKHVMSQIVMNGSLAVDTFFFLRLAIN